MWITGTATGLKDLLSKVVGHAEDNGWTVVYTTGGAAPRTDLAYFQGPGFGAGYECYFAMRTYEDALNNHYCIETRGYTSYDPSQNWDTQPGRSPNVVYARLWDAPMDYWLAISDRRILLMAKCSNTYHSIYAGFFNPFATPVEYPYPFYLASDAGSVGPFGNTGHDVRAPAFPGRGGAYLREAGGSWRAIRVYDESGSWDWQSGNGLGVYTIWPYFTVDPTTTTPAFSHPPGARVEPLPGFPDSMFMVNCYICGLANEAGVLGVLEGLYWVPGNTLSAEQLLTVGGEDYRVFIAISRSIESPSQFYAVREV